ncbi:MAG: ergot alkaloid biosynthesis protein [Gammaproteobacteria bacterium]|nr:ergot alkaloid biosynthesis protein [Gammaproteobacteria bacterium]
MGERILVTGGTGKTGRRVAGLLRGRGTEVLVASRTPQGAAQVRFDWADAGSYQAAIDRVGAAYLVAPAGPTDLLAAMTPFLERAVEAGVRRFVLLSASSLDEGGPMMGAVHAWLRTHAPEWVVLRPTWFMQNFSEAQHLHTIRDEGTIHSATGDGRVAFIDADDIAAVAVRALMDPGVLSGELILTGPEALSYGAVAALIATASGRSVTHRRESVAGMAARFEQGGVPAAFAGALAAMDGAIAGGAEDRITGEVERVIGSPPRGFAAFAGANVSVWR